MIALPTLEEIVRSHPGYLDELLDSETAAQFVGSTAGTLATYRSRGEGPLYFKLGAGRFASVRYSRRALIEWASQNRRSSTAVQVV
jgi:hypothetical protein